MLKLVFVLIWIKLAFSFTVELGIAQAINVALDMLLLGLVLCGIYRVGSYQVNKFGLVLVALVFVMIYVCVAQALRGELVKDALLYLLRFVVPILLFFFLAYYADREPGQLAIYTKFTLVLIALLSCVGVLFMPPMYNHEKEWLPTYFSGLHKSAYIASLSIISGLILRDRALWRGAVSLSVLAILFYFLVIGWGVRTAMAVLLVYVAFRLYRRLYNNSKVVLIVFAMIVAVALALLLADFEWNRFSSGRMNMWDVKLDMLNSADVSELFFGRGFGADKIEVEDWWGEKDSHNNYLQVLTEYGVFGLLLTLLMLFLLYRNVSWSAPAAAVMWGYLVSSMLSNGIMFRLVPGYIFSVALAAAVIRRSIPLRFRT